MANQNAFNVPFSSLTSKYDVIKTPGTVKMRVRSVSNPLPSLNQFNQGGEQKLVNFYALTQKEAKIAFEAQVDGTVDLNSVKTLVHGVEDTNEVLFNQVSGLAKGQEITAIVEWYTPKAEGSTPRLVVSSIAIPEVKAATNTGWAAFDEAMNQVEKEAANAIEKEEEEKVEVL